MRQQNGFTLIEIMVVVVIIGILSTLVTVSVIERIADARIEGAKSDIRAITTALTMYKLDNYQYPSNELGIRALVEKPASGEAPNWKSGGYLRKLREDPWENAYGHETDGSTTDVYTLGSDGKPGGEGEAADIYWSEI